MKKRIPINKMKCVTSSAADRRSAMPSLLLAFLIVSLLSLGTTFAHQPGVTERVSVDSAGNQGNDTSGFLSGPLLVLMAASSLSTPTPRISCQAATCLSTSSFTIG